MKWRDCAEMLRTRQLCIAHVCYIASVLEQCRTLGSRGGSIVLPATGRSIAETLPDAWRIMAEDSSFRKRVMTCEYKDGMPVLGWEAARPIPETDGWFEKVWADFRNKEIYQER